MPLLQRCGECTYPQCKHGGATSEGAVCINNPLMEASLESLITHFVLSHHHASKNGRTLEDIVAEAKRAHKPPFLLIQIDGQFYTRKIDDSDKSRVSIMVIQ
jgi:hypothetical protein